MVTVNIIIEILLAGIIGEIWVFLILFSFLDITSASQIPQFVALRQHETLVVIFFLALTYVWGWIIHFLSELVFDPISQNKYRDDLYREKKVAFFEVRTLVFQKGNEHTIKDIQFDRQLIRIARTNTLNFFMIFASLWLYLGKVELSYLIPLIAISFLICIFSFFQWRNRYRSVFRKFYDIYTTLKKERVEQRPGTHQNTRRHERNRTPNKPGNQ